MLSRSYLSVLLLLFVCLALQASQPEVYSRDLFRRGTQYQSLGMGSVAPMNMFYSRPTTTSTGYASFSVAPRGATGTFQPPQLTQIGQQTLPVIATTTADAVVMRVRDDDGDGGHTDVNQPLTGIWCLMLMIIAYAGKKLRMRTPRQQPQ